MTGWVYTALTCSYLCWNQGNFLFPFKTTAAIPTTRRGEASGLPGVFRAAPFQDVCAPFRSKELLFRKQRPQFTTCLEQSHRCSCESSLLLLNAPLGSLWSVKQHHREEKGLAVGSTAPLDSQQMETPEEVDVNMNFFAPFLVHHLHHQPVSSPCLLL